MAIPWMEGIQTHLSDGLRALSLFCVTSLLEGSLPGMPAVATGGDIAYMDIGNISGHLDATDAGNGDFLTSAGVIKNGMGK
jgi:hypothetical protein